MTRFIRRKARDFRGNEIAAEDITIALTSFAIGQDRVVRQGNRLRGDDPAVQRAGTFLCSPRV
jgi:hypothetical protein